jgi:hypothetical protein
VDLWPLVAVMTRDPLVCPAHGGVRPRVPWYLHVIEQVDGRWRCAHGQTVVDQHDRLPDAIAHLRTIAKILGASDVIIHWADGGVDNIGPIVVPANVTPRTRP